MPFTQEFVVEGVNYGTGERARDIRTNSAPLGAAFFCPTCARVWALCPVQGMEYDICSRAHCERCGKDTILGPAGSIWTPLEDGFNNALPRELLIREFWLAVRYQQHLNERGVQWTKKEQQNFSPAFGSSSDLLENLLEL